MFHRSALAVALSLTAIVAACGGGDGGAPVPAGALDPRFGGGAVTTPFGAGDEAAAAVLVQEDGKVVVAGETAGDADVDFMLARYRPDGTLDPAFGDAGKVVTSIRTGEDDAARAVVQQADGRLVAAGYSGTRMTVVRYLADGTLDPSFGDGGKAVLGMPSAEALALAVQGDGKLLVAGAVSSFGTGSDFALVRLQTDGSLDTTFGAGGGPGGVVTRAIGAGFDAASGVVVEPDGDIVVAGSSLDALERASITLLRYDAGGVADASFGADGLVTTGVDHFGLVGLALQPDGKLVVAVAGIEGFPVLVRYGADGAVDGGFGADGVAGAPLGDGVVQASALSLQPDGKLVVAGVATDDALRQRFAVARYTAAGAVDASFGDGGVSTPEVGAGDAAASAIARAGDGGLVAAGHANNGTDRDVAVAWLHP